MTTTQILQISEITDSCLIIVLQQRLQK